MRKIKKIINIINSKKIRKKLSRKLTYIYWNNGANHITPLLNIIVTIVIDGKKDNFQQKKIYILKWFGVQCVQYLIHQSDNL